ncbi:hypothetical protein HK097_008886 [Rhizophlyctis rosea]|uniref:Uncharacterized protein n=1 Tax=Rhizophlyctis rosea TaxID=64517 RepID=A0AAD5SPT4_9FUNG|nr:hypothetical protein HK097_008886 [Rhizophlyctis rosea]
MEMEDEYQESLLRLAGGTVPPSLQTVRKVHVVNMPDGDKMKTTGANVKNHLAPPTDYHHRLPPPPRLGNNSTVGATLPGYPRTPIIERKTDPKATDVVSLHPVGGNIHITDTTNIREAGIKFTGEPSAPLPIPKPVPDPVYNPLTRLMPNVVTAPSQIPKARPADNAAIEALKIEAGQGKRMRLTDTRRQNLAEGKLQAFTKINTKQKGPSLFYQSDLPHPIGDYDPPGMSGGNPLHDYSHNSLVPHINRAIHDPPRHFLPQKSKDAEMLYDVQPVIPPRVVTQVPAVKNPMEDIPQVVRTKSAVPMLVSPTPSTGSSAMSMVNNALGVQTSATPTVYVDQVLPVGNKSTKRKADGINAHGRSKYVKTEDPINPVLTAMKTVKERVMKKERDLEKLTRPKRDRKGKGRAVEPGVPFEFTFPQMTSTPKQQAMAALDPVSPPPPVAGVKRKLENVVDAQNKKVRFNPMPVEYARRPRGDIVSVEIPVKAKKGKAKKTIPALSAVNTDLVSSRTRSKTKANAPVSSRTRSKKK